MCLLIGGSASAQFTIYPKLCGSLQTYDFGKDNPYGLKKKGCFVAGIEITAHYNLTKTLSVLAGAGGHHTFESDSSIRGDFTYIPVYLGIRFGKKFYIEGDMGFNLPVESSGIGYLTGWFGRGGFGIVFDEFTIGAYAELHNIFDSQELSYVPDGYVPVKKGIGFGAFIECKL